MRAVAVIDEILDTADVETSSARNRFDLLDDLSWRLVPFDAQSRFRCVDSACAAYKLDTIRRLLSAAGDLLEPGGCLIVEFGFGQDAAVEAASCRAGWEIVRVAPDLQGIPRVAVLRR